MTIRPLPCVALRICRRTLLSLGFGILLVPAVAQANAIETERYFPLDHGSTWTMRGSAVRAMGEAPPPYTMVFTAVAGKVIDGKPTTKMSWTTDADDTDRVAQLFVRDAGATRIAAFDQMEPQAMKAECLPVPRHPHVFLPARVAPGQTFSAESTSRCEGAVVKMSVAMKVVGFEDTVVPAGKFRTLVLRHDYTSAGSWQGKAVPPSKQVTTLYLARGVGIVKDVTELYGTGTPFERGTDTEVLVSTNRKIDVSDKGE